MSAATAQGWSAERLFAGGGQTRAALRAMDWSGTPLGPVESWPAELLAAIRTLLPSEVPMLLWWGPEFVQIFNDAYTPLLGEKYPAALAQSAPECWAEIWDTVGPWAEAAMTSGDTAYAENELLFMRRHGYLEETYWTFSYSPIWLADGTVGGVFVATTDVTPRVVGDRRLDTLRELGTLSVAAADTAADACRGAVQPLEHRRTDLPVILAYLRSDLEPDEVRPAGVDSDPGELRLVASLGVVDGSRLTAEQTLGTSLPEVWQVAATGQVAQVTGLATRQPDGLAMRGPLGPAPVDQALVLPLQVSGRSEPVGVLVVGLSPYRELDRPYRAFVQLVTDRVSTALTDALAYTEQRRRAAALAEIDEAKTRFFANVSHELRTPLTLIEGPIEEALADLAQPVAGVQRERLEIVRRNVGRLRRLVDNLLDLVRSESGRLVPQPEPTDLASLTRGIAESFEVVMRRAGLNYVVEVSPLPREVYVDRDMWEKIVVNLLSNALKYTLAGEVVLRLADDQDGPDGGVVLTVRDTGVGIAADQQPLLFQRFHRVEESGGRSYEGAGIGLALVDELVVLHHGSVGVRSEPGVGSVFTVRLPYGVAGVEVAPEHRSSVQRYVAESIRLLASPPGGPPGGPAEDGASGPGPTTGAPPEDASTVLVVEDNADLSAFIATLLAPYWRVEAASDGRDALERIERVRPDLVLTDVMMPRLDGFSLLRALREDPRTALIPVIMLSGRAGEEAALEGLGAGADDYLIKPFSSRELLARVRAHLELARLRNHESAWRSAITDAMQEAFYILDDEGAVMEVNDAFRRLVGVDLVSLPQRPPYPWWPDPETEPAQWRLADAALQTTLASERGRVRLPVRGADGSGAWVEAVYSSIRDAGTGRRTYVGTLRDITDELLLVERQALVTRVSSRLAEAGDSREVLAVGMGELQELFSAAQAAIITRDNGADPAVVMGGAALPEVVRSALSAPVTEDTCFLAPDGADQLRGIGALVDAGEPRTVLWLTFDPPRPMPEADIAQFRMLGSTIAHALQRAKTYDVQRTVALTLQRSILGPAQLPVGFAVRYEPAVQPLEVGGDWYDVIQLAGDTVGVVVGDCVGRGLPAAAVMGQLRSACRALLLQAKGPAEVLSALDDFAALIPGARCTTLFCAIIDQSSGRVKYSAAGHPPAIVVHSDGESEVLGGAGSYPLAAAPLASRPEAVGQLRAGSTLLLYTDGLIERRREGLEVGIIRTIRAVTESPTLGPAALADHIVRITRPAAGYDDDTALLIYRHSAHTRFVSLVPARPSELKPLREELRSWLVEAGVSPGDASEMLLAIGEACTNSIEHGYQFDAGQLVGMDVSVGDGRLVAVISDTGSWIEPTQPASGQRGRGLMIMEGLMDEAVIDGGPRGTTVRLVKEIRHG